MKKLCIFDLDGTLVNSIEDLANAYNAALKKYHLATFPIIDYYHFVGNGVDKLIHTIIKDRQDLFDEVKNAFYEYYEDHCFEQTRPYPGIIEMLDFLKEEGCLLAVVSNKPDRFVSKIIKAIFDDRFDSVSGKKEGIAVKPCPELVLRVMQQYHVSAENTYYIGDSDVDIETAKNAGVSSVGVAWGFRGEKELSEAKAQYIVKEANDIIPIVYPADVAVSACLVGKACRYDGKSQTQPWIMSLLEKQHVMLICPEVAGGLSIPRIPCERVKERILNRHGEDMTYFFELGAKKTLERMKKRKCHQAILKSCSPSCGIHQIYDGSFQGKLKEGTGVFASLALQEGYTLFDETQEEMYWKNQSKEEEK